MYLATTNMVHLVLEVYMPFVNDVHDNTINVGIWPKIIDFEVVPVGTLDHFINTRVYYGEM